MWGGIIENNIMLPTILIEDGIGSIITTMEVYAPVLFVHVVDEFSVIPMEYFKRSSLNIQYILIIKKRQSNILNIINIQVTYRLGFHRILE